MESKEIIDGSKTIAEYLGFVYIPFSAEIKEKGMKAGYYKTVSAEPKIEKTIVKISGQEDKELNLNMNLFRYHNKNGWKLFEGRYYKYVCRHHGDLRYWNSLDELVPVIQKVEKENKDVKFHLNNNGCEVKIGKCWEYSSFTLPNWSNNVFKVIVEYLKQNYETAK